MPGAEVDPGAALDTAIKVNGDMAPETAYAMSKDPSLDGATMGHASKFLDAYGKIKESVGDIAKEPPSSPGFFSFHTLDAVADSVKDGVDSTVSHVNNFTYDLPTAVKNFAEGSYSFAAGAANRLTQTAVELGSGGGATWKNTGGLGSIEGENGAKPTFDWKNIGDEAYNLLKENPVGATFNPSSIIPHAQLSTEMQTQTAKMDQAYALYKSKPTADNEAALEATYRQYQSLQKAYAANGNLEDAVNTLHNATPQQLLFGKDNVWFMMAHTAAYTESLAAKKGWSYALAQLAPAVAVAVLTDGAMSAEIGIGTETYDTNLIAEAQRLEASRPLTADESQAVSEAVGRQNARNLIQQAQRTSYDVDPDTGELTLDDTTAVAKRRLQETLDQSGAVRRGIYNAADVVSKGVSPVFKIARGLAVPASDVRMNLVYQAAQAAALGNPDDAELWQRTANLQAVGANGQEEGQDGTALLKMMDLDPKAVWFSPLTDVANLADFYTKWLGSDIFGAAGKSLVARVPPKD